MVGPARILNKRIVIETHKRRQPETGRAGGRRHVDLSRVIEDGLVTYPGLPAVQVCDYLSREQSREHYEAGTEFHIASDRKSVVEGKSVSVRVDLGGSGIIKKKK